MIKGKIATLYRANGKIVERRRNEEEKFSLQEIVDAMQTNHIDYKTLGEEHIMIIDAESINNYNVEATDIFNEYNGYGSFISGNAFVIHRDFLNNADLKLLAI